MSILAVGLIACTNGHYQYTATTSRPEAARDARCAFDVIASNPGPGFVELGVLDWDRGTMGDAMPGTIAEFKERVREPVCRAGGQLVVAQINGQGVYVRGIVLARAE